MQKVIDVKEKDELSAFQSPVKGETIMEVCNQFVISNHQKKLVK